MCGNVRTERDHPIGVSSSSCARTLTMMFRHSDLSVSHLPLPLPLPLPLSLSRACSLSYKAAPLIPSNVCMLTKHVRRCNLLNDVIHNPSKISAEFTAAKAKVAIEVEVISEASAIGNGCGLLLVATTTTGCIFGGSALGKPKVKANVTGEKAAKELLSALQHGGCVDEWLQDQLIIFMALAEGTSEIKTGSLTLHTKTAITFATELCGASFDIIHLPEDGGSLNDVVVRGNGGGSNSNGTSSQAPAYGQAGKEEGRFLIRCKGVGHENI